MSEAVKKQLLKSAEKLTEVSLNELVAVAEVYAADTASPVDDGVVSAVKMLKSAFLDDLVNKIDGDPE
mgnify:CR=1 FL=1